MTRKLCCKAWGGTRFSLFLVAIDLAVVFYEYCIRALIHIILLVYTFHTLIIHL